MAIRKRPRSISDRRAAERASKYPAGRRPAAPAVEAAHEGAAEPTAAGAPPRRSRSRWVVAATATLLVVAASTVAISGRADAATMTLNSLTASVNRQSVTGTATVTASSATATSAFGICVRDASWNNVDFPLWANTTITSKGTTFTATKTFANGSYTYGVCVLANGSWSVVGAPQSFTVGSGGVTAQSATPTTQAPTPTTQAPAQSGSSMPVGNLPGWRQIMADDFTTNAGLGSFAGVYGSRWYSYSGPDTSHNGTYNTAKVLSASNGIADWYLHSENGTRFVAAIVGMSPSTGWGQQYGRYSVRFRSDVLPQYKMAFLLWPDSDNWGEGEVDFPEITTLGTGGKLYANLYGVGNLSAGTPVQGFKQITGVDGGGTGWHTATIEWTPGRITWYLDGATVGTTTSGVPSTKMHWVLQVETATEGGAPSTSVAGHFQVDWATMYAYAP